MWKISYALYSPFSPDSTFGSHERSLLLQFIVSSIDQRDAQEFFEHVFLLFFAFPEISSDALRKMVKKLPLDKKVALPTQKKIYLLLIPFLTACRDEEGLVLFLLRHRKALEPQRKIDSVLHTLYPNGLGEFLDAIQKNWHKRGYPSFSQEIEALAKDL